QRALKAMLLCLFAALPLRAQQGVPIVAVYGLSSRDLGDNVPRAVSDLVYSFIRELKTYRSLDLRSDPLPADLRVPDGADYIFYGNLVSQADGIKLELILKGGPFTITRLISRVYENPNRILLESRVLVRDLFDQSIALPDPSPSVADASPPEQTIELIAVRNPDSLAGSWEGEDGIERIMILRGGRGVAVLASGVSISLEILVSGDYLVVRQKGAAVPRQFMDLPDPVARQAAAIAPPIEWRFQVTSDQSTLSGTKKSVVIKNDGKNVLSMESVTLPVFWRRDRR
ncbi:MAG TPA: hypothetical protein PLU93_07755, partial [Treponemataceae bacterium]|nr:hypothetical protein [Treponemataceae bacterium]